MRDRFMVQRIGGVTVGEAEAPDAAGRGVLIPVLLENNVKIPLEFKLLQAANLRLATGSPSRGADERSKDTRRNAT
jgi:hypothetical protein